MTKDERKPQLGSKACGNIIKCVVVKICRFMSYSLYSSVYSCYPFLISSASVRSIPFLSFIEPIFAWNLPFVSLNFLEEISSLSHCIVFVYFFALICWGRLSYLSLLFFGTLHSDAYIFLFLLCFSLLFFSQLFVRPPQTAIFLFVFLFLGDGLAHCLLYNVTNLRP